MNNSRSNVYRGDFRKPVKAYEFTHASVFMRTRRAGSHFAASRIIRHIVPILDKQEAPVHPTLWVCRLLPLGLLRLLILCIGRAQPAKRDLGSLQHSRGSKVVSKEKEDLCGKC